MPAQWRRMLWSVCGHLQDCEFIAAEPCDGIRRLRAGAKPLRDRSEQLVSGTVTKRIVDRLELIEIEHENSKPIFGIAGSRGGLLEPLQKQKPVREPGQSVLPGLQLQLLTRSLESHSIADAQRHDDKDQERYDRRGQTVGTFFGSHASECLLFAEPNRHDKRKLVHNSIEDQAPDAVISCAGREIPSRGLRFGPLEQCAVAQTGSKVLGLDTLRASDRTDDPIGPDHSDRSITPDIDGIVEVGEMARIQRNENDATETSIRKRDAARQLNGRLSGSAANHRFADEEVVLDCVDVYAKMLTIADIYSRRLGAGGTLPG